MSYTQRLALAAGINSLHIRPFLNSKKSIHKEKFLELKTWRNVQTHVQITE